MWSPHCPQALSGFTIERIGDSPVLSADEGEPEQTTAMQYGLINGL